MTPESPQEVRILLVVDEPDLATTCQRFLRGRGYRPRVVQSGEPALALIETERPELVVADVPMPGGVDGLEILRHVQATGLRVPVILCVGRAAELPRSRSVEVGAAGYLIKPFSLVELGTTVRRALAPSQGPGGGPGA